MNISFEVIRIFDVPVNTSHVDSKYFLRFSIMKSRIRSIKYKIQMVTLAEIEKMKLHNSVDLQYLLKLNILSIECQGIQNIFEQYRSMIKISHNDG